MTTISKRPEPSDKGMGLFTLEFLDNPYPLYAELRAKSPVIWLEAMNAWLLTGYDAVQAAFMDQSLKVSFSEYQINRNGPTVVDEYYYKQFQRAIVAQDPPRHTLIRSTLRKALARPRIDLLHQEIETQCQRFVTAMIEQAASKGAKEAELVESYTNRIPHFMISSILGVPEEDRPEVAKYVADYAPTAEATPMTPEVLASVNAAAEGLDDYFGKLMAKKAANPDDGFISQLIAHNHEADDKLTKEEMTANVITLYVGGQDTQEKLMTNIILALHNHPDAMARLAENPTDIINCMDELYRYDSAGQFMGRTASEAVEIDGVKIPKGETVICSWAAANRDPKYFTKPDILDLDRKPAEGMPNHMTFGVGRHSCIGVNLAQSNIPRMLTTLLGELGPLEVDLEKSQRHLSIATRGFDTMQVSWG